ncbi:MAG: hypothetical protein JHC31_14990, partial [Sulfurihydrogenibium sp.]|nr:hypothetical protein [Sulfurihydrogenibium sp.]
MKELGVLCNCKFCRANSNARFENGDPVEADDYNTVSLYDREKNKYIIVDGVKYPLNRIVHTGGRRSVWIFLEENEEAILLSSKGKSFTDGRTKEEIEKEYEILKEYEASIHGCYKLTCHQTLLIVKK